MFTRPIATAQAWVPAFEQSVICDGGASMTRTFTSTSGDSWAIALRRSKFGATQNVLSTSIQFNSSDQIVAFGRTSTRVFRDVGWYVFLFNPTSMYVNGPSGMDEVTGTGSYAMASIVNPVLCGTANRFEGALAAFWHGDSVAWSVSDFVGSFGNTAIAKSPSLTYGTDGVRLLFADSANFGDDTSGNGNDWTPTGFVAADQSSDVPGRTTPVFSSLVRTGGATTYAEGGTRVTCTNTVPRSAAAPFGIPANSGKWYFEWTLPLFPGSGNTGAGLFSEITNESSVGQRYYWPGGSGTAGDAAGALQNSTNQILLYASGSTTPTRTYSGFTLNASTVYSMAFDSDTRKYWFGVDNAFLDSATGTTGNPSAGTQPTGTLNVSPTGFYYVGVGGSTPTACQFFFEESKFAYSPPTNFKPLHTGNLLTPTAPANPDTGTITANANANGPLEYLGYAPSASDVLTLGGSAVTWGTHADRLNMGFKVRTASSPYNDGSGSKSYSLVTTNAQYGGGDLPWPLAQ